MRIELLHYFLATCRAGSINMAAQSLHISQQGLDSAIRRLEKELDVYLFVRSKNGIVLTPEGQLLYNYAEKISNLYTDFEIELAKQKLKNISKSSTLSILSTSLHADLLTKFLQKFSEDFPQINCLIHEVFNEDIPLLLTDKSTSYHVGIISHCYAVETYHPSKSTASVDNSKIYTQPLAQDELAIFMGKQNNLAKYPSIPAEDLKNSQIILADNTHTDYFSSNNQNIVLNSGNTNLQQYYLTTTNCILCLPYKIGVSLFDEKKIISRPFTKPVYQKTFFATTHPPQEYTPEEKLLYISLKNWFDSISSHQYN